MKVQENIHTKGKTLIKHKCALCPYSTNILSNYKQHLNRHSDEGSSRPFPCSHSGCKHTSKTKESLKIHSKIHSDEKPFVCSHPSCNYASNDKKNLTVHTRLHTGEKPYKCQFESCSYAATTRDHLLHHTRTHTKERPYKCPEPNCEYSAAALVALKLHGLIHETNEGEQRPSFQCALCEYSTKRKRNLSEHIERHTLEKLFKCDEPNCKYEAKTNHIMQKHKRKHSDGKLFACSVESCNYRCKWKQTLSLHLKRHSDQFPYKCELCPFRGKIRSTVEQHLANVHSDPDFRPFKCTFTEPQCTLAFKRKGDLQKHLLTHNGEKKYSCPFPDCDYRAISKYQVTRHGYNIHNEEKKEKCTICSYSCKTKSDLTKHIGTHTKEKPYKCKAEGCGYRTKQPQNLRQHEQKNHFDLKKE